MRTTRCLLLAAAALALAAPAQAKGFFLGASVGQSSFEASYATNARFDADTTGWKGFVGFRVIRFFSAELAYNDLGSLSRTDGTLQADADGRLVTAFGVGILPLTPRFELYGKLGMSAWSTTVSGTDAMVPFRMDESGTDLAWGAGMTFNITKRFGIRLEWESFDLGDSQESRLVSLGLQVSF